MKIETTHIGPLPRRFNTAPRVQTIGYIPDKKDAVNTVFQSFNYSFILSGSGFYYHQGRRLEVKTPCVLTQYPEEKMYYGPELEWEELYLIYSLDNRPALEAGGLVPKHEPMWYLESGALLQEKISELARLLPSASQPFMTDRIDLVCQSIVLESRIHRTPSPLQAEERIIRQIEAHVRKDVRAYYDFDLIARKYGLHPAKFRRYWNKYIGVPPGRYLMKLRMAEAGRLLVETRMPVGEIARAIGFNDELYFSKKFRKEFGTTASAYRQSRYDQLSLKKPAAHR